jgi:hypothetical protein
MGEDASELEREPPDGRVAHVPCPFCCWPFSAVVDTKEGARRRRECEACKRRYNTREVIDAAQS